MTSIYIGFIASGMLMGFGIGWCLRDWLGNY